MKIIKSNNGFTLIEILGAIVILGILMGIGVGAYTKYRKQAAETSYDLIKKNAITAAENYFIDNPDEDEVSLQELVDKSYLETVQDPELKKETCDGKVSIFEKEEKNEKSLEENTYMVNLICKKHKSCVIIPSSLSCTSGEGIETDGEETYYNVGLENYDFKDKLTYAIRVKFNSLSSEPMEYFGNWEGAGGGLGVTGEDKNHSFFINLYSENRDCYVRAQSSVTALKNVWYIVVGMYDGENIKLYLDGRLIATKEMTGNVRKSTSGIIVGGNPQNNGLLNPANISVTDFLILNDTITDEEISQYFSNPKKQFNYPGDTLYSKSFE